MYADTALFIDNQWCPAADGADSAVINPATGDTIGRLAMAGRADLDLALEAAERGFRTWRRVPAIERSALLRRAGTLLRERVDSIAPLMTLEQGKPLFQSRLEILAAADTLDWFAEEARRLYGRLIPSRDLAVQQIVVKEPIGPVAAFTPWNFPVNQAVRKVAAALAAGCSIVLKGPEETPASCAALIQAVADAGAPAGVVNLVFGVPADISAYLIPHPVIRKVTFTGSTVVGKQLAALAGQHMKRVTMELGGHAPVIVMNDADIESAVANLSGAKYFNAGQICVAPTRFLIQQDRYRDFIERFTAASANLVVGNGLDAQTQMGPLANARRVEAMEGLVADALARGGRLELGGTRPANSGYFYAPTVLSDVPVDARILNEEPFGPVAVMAPFNRLDDALDEANRLPFGLAAYAYTASDAAASRIAEEMESGMVSINHQGLALPETPFGGIKDSGFGSEGGTEAMDSYINTKFVTRRPAG